MRSNVMSILVCALALAAAPSPALAQETQAPAAKAAPATVNINTATAEQLGALPGVGAKTAARIVEFRQKNGPFKKVEDLMNVKGIGEKSFLKLKPMLTTGAVKTDKPSPGAGN